VRSALLDVDGVTRVQVTWQEGKALVTYDARVTGVDALIAAINGAEGPTGPFQYEAAVSEPPRRATTPSPK